jgi:hypothetical protein
MRSVRTVSVAILAWLSSCSAAAAGEWTLKVELGSRWVEGMPITWSRDIIHLLGRDGQLWQFSPSDATNFRKQSDAFRTYSQSELRAQLVAEYGRGFEVSGSGHYLVVHPTGQRDRWTAWYEDLYRSMFHYFAARGFAVQAPRFPLVAVIYPDQQDFMRHAAKSGAPVNSTFVGYYEPTSNRIYQYDIGDPQQNVATIIHEASHQTAYNIGVHNRYVPNPAWVVEGIGTMFEAPGVWNSAQRKLLTDRIHHGHLSAYRKHFSGEKKPGVLASLVSDDRMFKEDAQAAYAYSWALMFYLAERDLAKLSQYLKLTAARRPFEPYTAPARLADFTRVFGQNLRMLEAQVDRYVTSLDG